MLLLRLHPEVAHRSCSFCRDNEHDDNGNVKTIIDATPEGDVEVPKKRPPGAKVPCETSVGCPKGHWEKPKGFCERSKQAYSHYIECSAVQSFPNDPMVRRNAAVIYAAEKTADRIEAQRNAIIAAGIGTKGVL